MEMSHQPSAVSRLLFLLLVAGCGTGAGARSDGPYDLILKGGWIVDGLQVLQQPDRAGHWRPIADALVGSAPHPGRRAGDDRG